jgi:hypothetical protein
MDGSAVADVKTVVAPLNLLAPMAETPVAYRRLLPAGGVRVALSRCSAAG